MNARHRLSFSLFPVKFSQIDLFYKYLDMFWRNCNPAGFLIKRAKRRLGCSEKTAGRAVGNSRWQCVDLIELTGHKKNRFPFDRVPRVFSVNAPKIPQMMCLKKGFWSMFSGTNRLCQGSEFSSAVATSNRWILQDRENFFPQFFVKPVEMRVEKEKTPQKFLSHWNGPMNGDFPRFSDKGRSL